jgi:hypothetical protein
MPENHFICILSNAFEESFILKYKDAVPVIIVLIVEAVSTSPSVNFYENT